MQTRAETPIAASPRVSAPLAFTILSREFIAPTVPQAVNGRLTNPGNQASIVVPREANLRQGERVRGVMGQYRTEPLTVQTSGAAFTIPVPSLPQWGLNLDGAREWRYEVEVGGRWVESASVPITVSTPISNATDNFNNLRSGDIPLTPS